MDAQILGRLALFGIAAEEYRQDFGRLPPDRAAILANNLAPRFFKIIEQELTAYRVLPNGYCISALGFESSTNSKEQNNPMRPEITFKVENISVTP
jgi:hypothetical protein